ncbi:MAG: hypothetical protein V4438_03880 [Patescibacteria group bacterium]
MLIPRSKIVEKIVRNDLGQEFKVLFLVYEEAGQVKARIISAKPLAESKEVILQLSGSVKRQIISTVVAEYKSELIPSPFESLLYFNLNIARGPNRI